VTYAELLFDLVFVFAVTQVSHALLANFTPLGALQTTFLLLSVWWVWVYTCWITNWLNPELTPIRILLFLLMLGGLVLSTSIPKAFDTRGLWFALAYAAMQVGPERLEPEFEYRSVNTGWAPPQIPRELSEPFPASTSAC